ncbi:MAG TPA: 2-oxo acid dehydrogenase subunit E2, partial [Chthonomonadales bacterium]|nr:2-oxo acid dehydrogenase subunit E2 [Chthonomonadales bacterium]
METDKAVMEVESPVAGTLKEWLATEGDILAIGAPIARMEVVEEIPAEATTPAPADLMETAEPGEPNDAGALRIPPRTRAYCRQVGISEEEMKTIPSAGAKLMPADVDTYIASTHHGAPSGSAADDTGARYRDYRLSQQQRLFIYRIKRSAQIVIPGTIRKPVRWRALKDRVDVFRAEDPQLHPSEFQTFAYCVARAASGHRKFRSALLGEETVREYEHLNLGIAVARENGELVTAVVSRADTLGYREFVSEAQSRIASAREGNDQADAGVQILLTYMGAHGVIDAVPVLVAPAVAVLFAGATYELDGSTVCNLVLTFDHRLINGVEAAQFLASVVESVEQAASLVER